jgi:O-antigen/teichoic acid export membrane protein
LWVSRGAGLKPFDDSGVFRNTVDSGNVRRLATRGVAATLFSGGSGLAIQIIATVFLARLLTPRDFGLVAIVTTFSLLLMNFGLNGFTEAIVHREDINHGQASNLFWINVAGSTLLAVCFAAAGPLLALFFKYPRVTGVAEWMALSIFLTGPSVIHIALLKRAMRFTEASANDLIARAVSVVVSICLGWNGWGYWALVAGAIAQVASLTVGAWILCQWVPGLPRKTAGTGTMVRYALNTYARYSTGYFTSNLDNFLVGWRLGPVQLGFYKKAYDLFALATSQLSLGLTVVAVSALSRLQKDVAQYKRYLLSALGVMAFIGMGISGDLTLVGKDLILVLLGPKWGESGTLFTIFAPGIGFMLLYGAHIWIHLSIGRADRWFRWGLVDLAVTTVFLFVGLQWQAEGIAVAWVAAYLLITWPAFWYAGKPIGLKVSSVFAVVWKYILAASTAGVTSYLIEHALPSFMTAQGTLWAAARLACVSVLFLVLYLIGVVILHRGYAPLRQVASLIGEMTARRRSTAPIPEAAGETSGPLQTLRLIHCD